MTQPKNVPVKTDYTTTRTTSLIDPLHSITAPMREVGRRAQEIAETNPDADVSELAQHVRDLAKWVEKLVRGAVR